MKKKLCKFIVLFLVISAVSACAPKKKVMPTPRKTDPGISIFNQAENAFQNRLYDSALTLYETYLRRFPDGPSAPTSMYRKGEIHQALGNPSMARQIFRYLLRRYPESYLVSDARLSILTSLHTEGLYPRLKSTGRVFLQSGLPQNDVYKILTIMGDAALSAGALEDALQFYGQASVNAPYDRQATGIEKLRAAIVKVPETQMPGILNRLSEPGIKALVMYQWAMTYMDSAQKQKAAQILREFVASFPDHQYTGDARQMIEKAGVDSGYARYSIGCMLPLSGSHKAYGNRALKGIELALVHAANKSGGVPLNIVIKDTESDEAKAKWAMEELAAKEISAIIGPIKTAEAVAFEAQKNAIPIILLTGKDGVTNIGSYVFRNFITPKMQVQTITDYAMGRLGLKRFAILYPNEKYGTTFRNLFWDQILSYGGKVVGVEPYQPDQTDFSDPIKKLVGRFYIPKNRRTDNAPTVDFDAIFIPDSAHKAGLIVPQLAYHEVENVQLLGTNLWHSQKLLDMARNLVQGAIMSEGFFSESTSENVRNFVKNYQDTYGESPGFIESVAYDSVMILVHLLNRPELRYRSDLRDALMNVRGYPGVTGMTSFDETGEVHKTMYILKVEGDRFIEAAGDEI